MFVFINTRPSHNGAISNAIFFPYDVYNYGLKVLFLLDNVINLILTTFTTNLFSYVVGGVFPLKQRKVRKVGKQPK